MDDNEWRMCVCIGNSWHAFDVSHIGEVTFRPDSFLVERYWQYAYEQMDSVVFRQSDFPAVELAVNCGSLMKRRHTSFGSLSFKIRETLPQAIPISM